MLYISWNQSESHNSVYVEQTHKGINSETSQHQTISAEFVLAKKSNYCTNISYCTATEDMVVMSGSGNKNIKTLELNYVPHVLVYLRFVWLKDIMKIKGQIISCSHIRSGVVAQAIKDWTRLWIALNQKWRVVRSMYILHSSPLKCNSKEVQQPGN